MALDKFRETVITWDTANRKVYQPLRVSGSDEKGRKLVVQVVNDGVIEDLTGVSLSLAWRTRKSVTGLDPFTARNPKEGIFELFYTNRMLQNVGVLRGNFVLIDATGRIVSEEFNITVTDKIDDSAAGSQAELSLLTQALSNVSGFDGKISRLSIEVSDATKKINLLSSGLGKTFPNLLDLQTAFPSGDTKDHVVASNGHRYFWSDGEWKDGGLWNAIAIAENSITQKELSFTAVEGDISKNKFNKNDSDIVKGKYINNTNGNEYANASYEIYTMNVMPQEKYVLSHGDQTAFYTSEGVYISGDSSVYSRGPRVVTVPPNAYIMRTSVFSAIRDAYQIELGSQYTPYEPYRIVVKAESLPIEEIKSLISGSENSLEMRLKSIFNRVRKRETVNIKLVGDSITNGVGGTGYDTSGTEIIPTKFVNVSGKCWANDLKGYIEQKFPNSTVQNFGISGTTTTQVLRNKNTIIKETDDIVVVMLGTNDRQLGNLETTKNNLISIGERVKSFGNQVVFMSSIPTSIVNEQQYSIHMEDIDNTICTVSEYFKSEYVSLYKEIVHYCDLKNISIDSLLADGIHPNDIGYEAMYRIVASSFGFGTKRQGATW